MKISWVTLGGNPHLFEAARDLGINALQSTASALNSVPDSVVFTVHALLCRGLSTDDAAATGGPKNLNGASMRQSNYSTCLGDIGSVIDTEFSSTNHVVWKNLNQKSLHCFVLITILPTTQILIRIHPFPFEYITDTSRKSFVKRDWSKNVNSYSKVRSTCSRSINLNVQVSLMRLCIWKRCKWKKCVVGFWKGMSYRIWLEDEARQPGRHKCRTEVKHDSAVEFKAASVHFLCKSTVTRTAPASGYQVNRYVSCLWIILFTLFVKWNSYGFEKHIFTFCWLCVRLLTWKKSARKHQDRYP